MCATETRSGYLVLLYLAYCCPHYQQPPQACETNQQYLSISIAAVLGY